MTAQMSIRCTVTEPTAKDRERARGIVNTISIRCNLTLSEVEHEWAEKYIAEQYASNPICEGDQEVSEECTRWMPEGELRDSVRRAICSALASQREEMARVAESKLMKDDYVFDSLASVLNETVRSIASAIRRGGE